MNARSDYDVATGAIRRRLSPLRLVLAAFVLPVVLLASGCGSGGRGPSLTSRFVQSNLISDQAGVAANTDANLVNAWGISMTPSGPFWVSDNGTGKTTVYDSSGASLGLVVTIPGVGGATGTPTGQVANQTASFALASGGPAKFIFASEDGTISAWNSGSTAVTVVNRSGSGAVYKGLATGLSGGSVFLYAANFHGNSIDRFDANFNFVNSFTDPAIPAGYAPFNVAFLNSKLYVTYAKQLSPANHDDDPGAGNGFVDVFNADGTSPVRLVSRGMLNSPWGMVIAPSSFGDVSNALLVGNFGDGWINAYNPATGDFLGSLKSPSGSPIAIDGLWGLTFGNGGAAGSPNTLYFSAGPGGESHGLFGSLTLSP